MTCLESPWMLYNLFSRADDSFSSIPYFEYMLIWDLQFEILGVTKHINLSLSTQLGSLLPCFFSLSEGFTSQIRPLPSTCRSATHHCRPKSPTSGHVSSSCLLRQVPFVLFHLLLHPRRAPFHSFREAGSSIPENYLLMGLGSLDIGINSGVCFRVTRTILLL